MERERVVFAFFIVLALTLNFGFFLGDIDNPDHHEPFELGAAIVVSLIATVLKFGDRSPMGSTLLATSLVADLQLIVAATLWGFAANFGDHIVNRVYTMPLFKALGDIIDRSLEDAHHLECVFAGGAGGHRKVARN